MRTPLIAIATLLVVGTLLIGCNSAKTCPETEPSQARLDSHPARQLVEPPNAIDTVGVKKDSPAAFSQDTTASRDVNSVKAEVFSTGVNMSSPMDSDLTKDDQQKSIKCAEKELARLQVPFNDRVPVISTNDKEVVISYPPPNNARAGNFVIKVKRNTWEVIDVKIGR